MTVEQCSPLVRRLLAPNASPYTHTGTQVHLVGTTDVAVIDPGPDDPDHCDRILAAIGNGRLTAILCTHTHRDHSPAAATLRARTGAPVVGCAPLTLDDDGPRADAAFDHAYRPDRVLGDGDGVTGDGWTLTAVATPGHTSNHLAFALSPEDALFSGDHVMGWSTTVVSLPDGNMTAYIASLERLLARPDDRIYYPAHGDPIDRPQRFVRSLIGHRRQREGRIVRHIQRGEGTIPVMVAAMYAGLDPRLHGAASRSVLAHLIDLEGRGLVRRASDERWVAA